MNGVNKEQIESLSRKYFPFPTPNPGQMEAIHFALGELLSGKRHVILELPTALGKSAIAQTIHLVMNHLSKGHRTQIVTATKGLQDQYVTSVKGVYDLKGKTNYPCDLGHGFYGTPGCKRACSAKQCVPGTQCTYIRRRNNWIGSAELRLTNNAFLCSAPIDLIGIDGDKQRRAHLTILDECHEIENSVIESAAIDLDLQTIHSEHRETQTNYSNHILELCADLHHIFGDRPFMNDIPEISQLIGEHLKSPVLYRAKLKSMIDAGDTSYAAEYDEVDETIESFTNLVQASPGEWIITRYEKLKRITLKPVYAASVSRRVLFNKSDQFLHMSATICGADEYARTLGVPDGEWSYFAATNPIPLESRKVKVIKGLYLSRNFTKWDTFYRLIDRLLTRHSAERGIVHTVSFDLAKKIHENLSSQNKGRCLVSGNMNDIMNWMRTNPTGVVLSPSVEKGYDFKGDLSRFQILAKMPFLYLGDPHISLNCKRSPKWYARSTILRVVQSVGRSIRGVDDWASTYVIDENFLRLTRENYDLFPEWFTDSIEVLN